MSETKMEGTPIKETPIKPQAKPSGMFGITEETKASNNVPIPAVTQAGVTSIYPTGYHFPIAKLVNVVSQPEFEKKDLNKVAILQFIFRDKDGRQFIHTEWEVENDDAKFKEKIEGMNTRIKHMYITVFNSFPQGGIGRSANSFGEFFNQVADAFNNVVVTKNEKQVKGYTTFDFFLKLVYYKDRLGFPLGPNFIERINPQAICCKQLTINARYDSIKPTTGGSSAMGGGVPGMGAADMPDFDKSFEGFD